MAGFRMVPLDRLTVSSESVSHGYDNMVQQQFWRIFKRFGQFKPILVAKVDGNVKIIDGNEMLKALKNENVEQALVFNFGDLTMREYTALRILFNYHQPRTDYLGIAQMVKEVAETEHDLIDLSNKTRINLTDLKRFHTLLDFDWDAFEKTEINPEQLGLFD